MSGLKMKKRRLVMSNKREYEFKGTVTIGTDEYRDLIEDCISNEKSAHEYRSKFWAEENVSKRANERADAAESKLAELTTFLTEQNLTDKFKLWKISREEQ